LDLAFLQAKPRIHSVHLDSPPFTKAVQMAAISEREGMQVLMAKKVE